MKIIVCCLLLCLSSGLVWAGGGLQGTVRDSCGNPIKSAEIRIEGGDGNVRVIERNDLDVVVMGREYARPFETSGARPML